MSWIGVNDDDHDSFKHENHLINWLLLDLKICERLLLFRDCILFILRKLVNVLQHFVHRLLLLFSSHHGLVGLAAHEDECDDPISNWCERQTHHELPCHQLEPFVLRLSHYAWHRGVCLLLRSHHIHKNKSWNIHEDTRLTLIS